jgi:hypothetical protein
MKRLGIIFLGAVAAACGSVEDKNACATSLACPAGQYCAVAEGDARCWPDTVAPAVASVAATCNATPCLRDGVLHVEATATDDHEVLDAAVTLDLDPSRPVAMMRSGARWVADVQLRRFPFEAFERGVTASVTVRDGAKTASAVVAAAAVGVTRLRWTFDAGAPMTGAVVASDGTAIAGLSRTSDQLLAIDGAGTMTWVRTVGADAITAVPALGAAAIWIGSRDGGLHGVKLDGSGTLANVGIASGGVIDGSVAVSPTGTNEWGFAASRSGRVVGASTASDKPLTSAADSFTAGPVITASGRVFAATDVLNATMRCYDFDGAFSDNKCVVSSNPSVGNKVLAPLAIDSAGDVWTAADDGKLSRTTAGGVTTNVVSVGASLVDSPVIASNGDVIVGDQSGLLHRYTSTGASVWTTAFNLGGPVLAPMILANTETALVTSTKSGAVHGLRADGTKVWSGTLGSTELRAGNIFTPPGQPPGAILSTAYFPAANGKLYAVVVDGQLDTAAPWPKAFHDPRNTSNAGTKP